MPVALALIGDKPTSMRVGKVMIPPPPATEFKAPHTQEIGNRTQACAKVIRVSDLLLVNHKGEVVKGDRPVNQAAFAIYSQVHAARPDVIAAAHAHSLYGKTWSSLGRLLSPITQDACTFYEDHALFNDFTGVVLDPSEGQRIAQALGNKKAVILQNHGLLTTGETVDAAAWWFIIMERLCQTQLLAESARQPIAINPEIARLTRTQVGRPESGWFSFQPLYDRIIREEPDLLN